LRTLRKRPDLSNSSEPKAKKINRKCKNVKIPFFVVFNYSLRREKIKEMHRLIDLRRISTVNRGFPAKRFFFAISNWDFTSLIFSITICLIKLTD
jgi:hypothetical protein